ncbi:CobW family GTP-binding protein [Fictibacillus phosphorivorans]|uniref:CobW family GTP-binding protein n=1 Tax=Fictibacillus phosphorivorans TaxID=1221500 RepID=UPI00203CD2F4|nr:CobW family GTP-binding protein [Fictibacillus phosphorivorans]MCM3719224.1 CobW family GTP-binding protein [Fictibacillus phosphorivorans]MCM3776846.1 CobW family GTP-binding protein [Fictibacillus phosphorivorans]
MKKTNVIILAGFLGSGKTTLLKQLLQYEKERNHRTAVLMNELGEVSVDSDAVPGDIPLKELLNGCICCSLSDQLEKQLWGLCKENELDTLIIEATGAAHPIDVLDACLSPYLFDELEVSGIISIMDAPRWLDRGSMSVQAKMLMIEQLKHADFIIWNKTGTLTDEQKKSLKEDAERLNAGTPYVLTDYAKVDITQLFKLTVKDRKKHQQVTVDKLKVKTWIYSFQGAIKKEAFEDWLREAPSSIYRIKG